MPSAGQSPGTNNRGSVPTTYFPETFKDFFSMLTEDEDHGGVITNLLEDKALPRTPNRSGGGRRDSNTSNHSRSPRCDKPFCCHNNTDGSQCGASSGIYLDSQVYSAGGGLTRTLSSKYYRRRPSQNRLLPPTDALLDSAVGSGTSTGSSVTSLNNNFGRSNSFRLNRPGPSAASTYSSYLSYQPAVLVDRKSNNKSNGTCKHIQYCCLHQDSRDGSQHNRQPQQSNIFQSTPASMNTNASTLSLNERTSTGRLLPISPAGPSRVAIGKHLPTYHHHNHPQQHHTQDGINFSDDEKKSLIYPQLTTTDQYGKGMDQGGRAGGGFDNNGDSLQQQKQRYSLLAKSYDQINRSRIFGECLSGSGDNKEKWRRMAEELFLTLFVDIKDEVVD